MAPRTLLPPPELPFVFLFLSFLSFLSFFPFFFSAAAAAATTIATGPALFFFDSSPLEPPYATLLLLLLLLLPFVFVTANPSTSSFGLFAYRSSILICCRWVCSRGELRLRRGILRALVPCGATPPGAAAVSRGSGS